MFNKFRNPELKGENKLRLSSQISAKLSNSKYGQWQIYHSIVLRYTFMTGDDFDATIGPFHRQKKLASLM